MKTPFTNNAYSSGDKRKYFVGFNTLQVYHINVTCMANFNWHSKPTGLSAQDDMFRALSMGKNNRGIQNGSRLNSRLLACG